MNLRNVFEWFAGHQQAVGQDWLLLGKGPSFSHFSPAMARDMACLTLNDAIREVPGAAIAHFIDLEAFLRNVEFLGNAQIVVMPWFPHEANVPGAASLQDLADRVQPLADLARQQRLFWYDLSSAAERRSLFPVIQAVFFSAEAAFDLLAQAGVRRVRSLGVDGGTAYSERFGDLSSVSRLSNGQPRFDRQFESFARVICRTGVDYSPWDMPSPVRVFVASTPGEALPVKVLEHSIRRHARATVQVIPLWDAGIDIPKPKDARNQPRTPFSFQRFLIPQLCGHEGRAIYLDADMLVFKDIVDLWRRPMDDAQVLTTRAHERSGRRPQFSVMVLDCGRLPWKIDDIVSSLDAGTLSYEELIYECRLARVRADVEPHWNSLESWHHDRTALLHYTDMNTQPWVTTFNPLGYLWVQALREAIEVGSLDRAFVEDQVCRGHVRPSLLYQLDAGIDDPLLLPDAARALDAAFVAPYRALQPHRASPWRGYLLWLRAAFRSRFQATAWYRQGYRIRRWIRRQWGGASL